MSDDKGHAPRLSEMAQALGGVRGFIDSSLAPGVFVLVRIFSHKLGPAILAALAVGLVVLVVRLARKQPPQQAVSGFVGLGIAAAVSAFTGTGKGFFLPGIVTTGLTAVAALVSLLLGKPFVALALAAYDERYAGWQTNPALRRACTISSAVWTFTLFLRTAVASAVYSIKGDHSGLLLIVINAVKIPSIIIAAAVTYVLVKGVALDEPTAPELDGGV